MSLVPIIWPRSRAWAREREGVDISRQGFGRVESWEVSWLDHDGKPVMATGPLYRTP